ncbi:MAG: hypothetical protein J7M06_03085 [Proteobacteria bacterium]|nr:hypothetical protein [Pseudomonadota bacterium]
MRPSISRPVTLCDITGETDEAKSVSPKTLWNMRKIITDNELDKDPVHQTTDTLARVFNVDTTRRQINSVHIRFNMCHLSRIRIFAETIHKFLVSLRRQHKDLYKTISQKIIDRCFSKDFLDIGKFS